MKNFDWKKVLPHVIAIIVFLLVSIIFCSPALNGKVLQQHDIVGSQGMAKNAIDFNEKYGHMPLWNTNLFSGMPNFQVLISWPHPLLDFSQIFTLGLPKPISFFFLACLTFYLLCIALRTNPYIGILGGLAFAFSTYNPVIINAGHDTQMFAVAWAPGLLAGIMWLYDKKYWLGLALTAFFATVEVTANHPQINFYLFIIIGFMTIGYMVKWIRNKEWKHIAIVLPLIIFGALIGVGNAAVTLMTTFDYSKYTMRGGKTMENTGTGIVEKKTKGLDIDYAFQYSYGKGETLTTLMPNAYGGSSAETFEEDSKFVQELSEKNVPENAAAQLGSQLPKYWGGLYSTSGPFYFGAIIGLLFIVGCVVSKSHHKWWIMAAAIFGMFLSWGQYFIEFNSFLFHHMPLYNKFRAPSMSLTIVQILAPILAVITLQQLLFTERNDAEKKKLLKNILYTMAGLTVFIGLVYIVNDYHASIDNEVLKAYSGQQGGAEMGKTIVNSLIAARKSMFINDWFRLIGFALLFVGLIFLYTRKVLSPLVVIVILIAVNSFDLLAIDKKYLNENNYIESDSYTDYNFKPSTADAAILNDKDPHFRVYNLAPDRFSESRTSYFHRSLGGYHPAKLRLYQDLIENQLSTSGINMPVLNMLDTRYFLIPNQQGKEPNVQKNDSAFGSAWFVQNLQPLKGPVEEMKALSSFNPQQTALIDVTSQKTPIRSYAADPSASIKLTKYNNDTAEYATDTKTEQFAVFSEIYYPAGWNAYVDGKKTDHYKVDYLLRGMPVAAGQHTISFRFEPRSYAISSKIAMIAGILLYIVLFGGLFMSYKSKELSENRVA